MRRRLAVLLSAVLAASTLAVMAQTQPAQADTDVCAGAGTASIAAPGLFYPGFPNQASGGLTTIDNTTTAPTPLTTTTTVNVHTAKLLPFHFQLGTGTCVTKPGIQADGMVSGWCGHSWGTGVTDNAPGHRFSWVSAGGTLIITGELIGSVTAVPDAVGGQSCLTGALQFIIAGGAALIHCTVKNKLSNLIITDTHNLTTTDIPGVHTFNTHVTTTGNYHMWHKVCIGV